MRERDFQYLKKLIAEEIGIVINDTKSNIIKNKLSKRLEHYNLKSSKEYLELILKNPEEKQEVINLITINETKFFREKIHFDILREIAKERRKIRLWSAASSFGAEAYSAAMVLEDSIRNYEILGTDINTKMIQKARRALFPLSLADNIPQHFKKKYCLKGVGKYSGMFTIVTKIKEKTHFEVYNLLNSRNNFGKFDIIFVRNVLYYFDKKVRKEILTNLLNNLKEGGFLFISLTETLKHLEIDNLKLIGNSVYQKIGGGKR